MAKSKYEKAIEKGMDKWVQNYLHAKKSGLDAVAGDIEQHFISLASEDEFTDSDWEKLASAIGVDLRAEQTISADNIDEKSLRETISKIIKEENKTSL